MPIYEFECEAGHIREVIFELGKCPRKIICRFGETSPMNEGCTLFAEKIWSRPANIQIGQPTKVFVNPKTGDSFIASHSNEKAPIGYMEKELKGPMERSAFEKVEQFKNDITNEIVTAQMEERRERSLKARHDNLKANLSKVAAESDNPTATAELLQAGMNRSKSKKRFAPRKSDVMLAVNHQNSSNIQDAPTNKK